VKAACLEESTLTENSGPPGWRLCRKFYTCSSHRCLGNLSDQTSGDQENAGNWNRLTKNLTLVVKEEEEENL